MDEKLQYNVPSDNENIESKKNKVSEAFVGNVYLSSDGSGAGREFDYSTIKNNRFSAPISNEPPKNDSAMNSPTGQNMSYETYSRAQQPLPSSVPRQVSPPPQSGASAFPNGAVPRNPAGSSVYPNSTVGYAFPNAYPQGQYSYYPQPGYAGGYGYQPYYYMPGPKELEKKEIKKVSGRSGALTITIFIVMFVVAFIVEITALFCGVVEKMPSMEDPYAGFSAAGFYLYEGLTSLISIFIPTLILAKKSDRSLNKLMPFEKIEGKKLVAIVFGGLSLCMVAQIVSALLGINLGLFGIDIYKNMETHTATGIFDLIMNSVCTALIPALVEEFAYRGLVVGLISEYDEKLAVFASAYLFGMLHGNLVQIPFALIVGFVLGYVRVKTKSMLPGILIHFGNNFYAVLVSTIDETLPEKYQGFPEMAFMLLIIAVGLVALYYLTKNHKEFFEFKENKKSYLTGGEKIKTFFSTGTVIASTIILCIESVILLELL